MSLAILDIQHIGKRSAPGDLGASADLDGDGRVEPDEREALLVVEYAGAAAAELGRLGHQVVVIARGEYSERHRRAIALASAANPAAYVACHLNVGADYSLVCHDARSARGRELAEALQRDLGRELAGRKVRVEQAAPTGTWAHAYNCIAGIYAGPRWISGVCFEPLSVDRDAILLRTEDGARRIGRALAAGLHAHLTEAA